MSPLSSCPSCQGFNPAAARACLHCQRPLGPGRPPRRASWVATLWTLTGASATALTLMACYGMPPCEDGTFDCVEPPDAGNCDVRAEADGGDVDAGDVDAGDCVPVPDDAGVERDAGMEADAGP
ncbi:hypothetical protein [Corallococcus terminator]|uniref:Uncharacterized protein n=1 Tax=Corallococcus terminator TaxID=2316733 RepID=A0A3A8JK54_9BACT|nr:hypothetical protein [Corallococcus terminator]RKG92684.1 hypothetical protein D7V88_05325 [Corallococcus terminator]